jgi:hypothetical protein
MRTCRAIGQLLYFSSGYASQLCLWLAREFLEAKAKRSVCPGRPRKGKGRGLAARARSGAERRRSESSFEGTPRGSAVIGLARRSPPRGGRAGPMAARRGLAYLIGETLGFAFPASDGGSAFPRGLRQRHRPTKKPKRVHCATVATEQARKPLPDRRPGPLGLSDQRSANQSAGALRIPSTLSIGVGSTIQKAATITNPVATPTPLEAIIGLTRLLCISVAWQERLTASATSLRTCPDVALEVSQ